MKTKIGYKLLEREKATGKLYPLFIGKNEETKMQEWMKAEYIPTKGFAKRAGWHIGNIPFAPWLMSMNGTYKARNKKFERVFCLVEYVADIDYQEEANRSTTKDLGSKIPENGYYLFDERKRGLWVITGAMKINKVLTWEEVDNILKENHVDVEKGFEPYKKGFEKRAKTLAEKKNKETK